VNPYIVRGNAEVLDEGHNFRSFISLWLGHGDPELGAPLGLRRAVDAGSIALSAELEEAGWDAFGLFTYLILAGAVCPIAGGDERSVLNAAVDRVRRLLWPGDGRNAAAHLTFRTPVRRVVARNVRCASD